MAVPFEDTIAAIATPPGQGGIAVIRLSGPHSYDVASNVFWPKNQEKMLNNMAGYTAVYGSFAHGGQTLDDGIALCFHAPHSYTGEEMVELSCHGSEAVSQAILAACIEQGARPAGPGEYTRRAFMNGRLTLTQAEAVMDLISASSRQGAAFAESALKGALYRKIQEIKRGLVVLAGHLAAYVDYPEEDVDPLTGQAFLAALAPAIEQLQALVQNYHRGEMVMRGVQAAIVGPPNVGKSTIFNLLSGFERNIVTPLAGTTRDVIRERIQIGGITLLLSDTAGLHDTRDMIEQEGIRRSYEALNQAGFVMAVYDGSQPLDDAALALAQQCRGRPALAIINKSDLGTVIPAEALAPYFKKVIVVSAKEEAAVQEIERAVVELLDLQTLDTDAALLANQRQLEAARAALAALQEAKITIESEIPLDAAGVCLDDALYALAELTGENVSEAVIDEVFSKFCVGK